MKSRYSTSHLQKCIEFNNMLAGMTPPLDFSDVCLLFDSEGNPVKDGELVVGKAQNRQKRIDLLLRRELHNSKDDEGVKKVLIKIREMESCLAKELDDPEQCSSRIDIIVLDIMAEIPEEFKSSFIPSFLSTLLLQCRKIKNKDDGFDQWLALKKEIMKFFMDPQYNQIFKRDLRIDCDPATKAESCCGTDRDIVNWGKGQQGFAIQAYQRAQLVSSIHANKGKSPVVQIGDYNPGDDGEFARNVLSTMLLSPSRNVPFHLGHIDENSFKLAQITFPTIKATARDGLEKFSGGNLMEIVEADIDPNQNTSTVVVKAMKEANEHLYQSYKEVKEMHDGKKKESGEDKRGNDKKPASQEKGGGKKGKAGKPKKRGTLESSQSLVQGPPKPPEDDPTTPEQRKLSKITRSASKK
jgi:hypothetical protein